MGKGIPVAIVNQRIYSIIKVYQSQILNHLQRMESFPNLGFHGRLFSLPHSLSPLCGADLCGMQLHKHSAVSAFLRASGQTEKTQSQSRPLPLRVSASCKLQIRTSATASETCFKASTAFKADNGKQHVFTFKSYVEEPNNFQQLWRGH